MVARTGWTRTQQQKCLSYITEEAKAQETQRRRTEPKVCYAIDGEVALLPSRGQRTKGMKHGWSWTRQSVTGCKRMYKWGPGTQGIPRGRVNTLSDVRYTGYPTFATTRPHHMQAQSVNAAAHVDPVEPHTHVAVQLALRMQLNAPDSHYHHHSPAHCVHSQSLFGTGYIQRHGLNTGYTVA